MALELTDVIDTTQLLFVQGVNSKFEVAKKLASVNSLCRTPVGKNIFKVEKTQSTI